MNTEQLHLPSVMGLISDGLGLPVCRARRDRSRRAFLCSEEVMTNEEIRALGEQ